MTRAEYAAARPELTQDNERVIDVWLFCGGWRPDLVPVASAYYGVDDLDSLLHVLLALRDYLNARAEDPE